MSIYLGETSNKELRWQMVKLSYLVGKLHFVEAEIKRNKEMRERLIRGGK